MGNYLDSDEYYPQYANQQKELITILLDKDSYFHGDYLTGTIQLNLLNYFHLADIIVSLKLNEGWVNNIQKENTQADTNEVIVHSIILNIRRQFNVVTPLVTLPPGMHSFPFSFPIPVLQPSFELSTKQCKGFIRYALGVATESIPAQTNQKHVAIHSKAIPLMHPLTATNDVRITHMVFLDKGSVSLNVSLQKNNITFQETVPITITIDNTNGNLDLKHVKVCLIRQFKFHKKTSTQEEGIENIIKTDIFPFDCKKNSKLTQTVHFVIQEQNLTEFMHNQVFNPYPSSISKDKFLPTVITNIFTCCYQIKISAYFTSFVFYSSRPRVILNVALVHDPSSVVQQDNVRFNPINNNINQNVFQGTQSMVPLQPNYPNQIKTEVNQLNYQPQKVVAQSQLDIPFYIQQPNVPQQPINSGNNNQYTDQTDNDINEVKDDDCPIASHIFQPLSNDNQDENNKNISNINDEYNQVNNNNYEH